MVITYAGRSVIVVVAVGCVAGTVLNGMREQSMTMLACAAAAGILVAATAREFTPPARRKRRRMAAPLRRWVSAHYVPEPGAFSAVLKAAAAAHFLTIVVVAAGLYGLVLVLSWTSSTFWEPLLWPSAVLVGTVAAVLGSLVLSQEPDELLRASEMEPRPARFENRSADGTGGAADESWPDELNR